MKIEAGHVGLTIGRDTILRDICLQLTGGKIYGLIGRNGSGKTMLMKVLCGFIHPTSGTVTIDGKILGRDIDFPDSIGVIIETPGFVSSYSGFRNLKYLADINRKVKKDKIRTAMELVGLDPDLKKSVGHYSLGMRQRLGIAQAIMEDPDFLVLDEPFNGLDREGREEMMTLFRRLRDDGKLILMASHIADDINRLCDEKYYMEDGEIQLVDDLS